MYHYTNLDNLRQILENKSLRLVSLTEISDLSDRPYTNMFATIVLLREHID